MKKYWQPAVGAIASATVAGMLVPMHASVGAWYGFVFCGAVFGLFLWFAVYWIEKYL
jgi:hypothetical protein